ncbi:MAG: DNA helicase UvrD [Curvibacter sp.]|nr:MAG: DNA helicase UvrD [Curvibacter sp.]
MSQAIHAAYEHNGRLVEAQRFYEIACDPRRSVVVEACAGAGKTWMLVSRMLRALMEGTQPHEILAITFTKKAAGEMRQRLQEWLREFAHLDDARLQQELHMRGVRQAVDAAQLQALRGLHAQLLAGGRPVQIRTFHSWFAALLGSAPMGVLHHLGLPAQYELLENDAAAVAKVWLRFQTRVAGDAVALVDYQDAVRLYGRHQTHKALEAALNKRTEFDLADAQGVVDASVQHFTAQFPAFAGMQAPHERLAQASVQALLWDSARALGQCSGKKCQSAASELGRALTGRDTSGVFEALFTKKGEPLKLSDKLVDLTIVQSAQALLQEVQQAELQDQAWQHQQRMARLARGLIKDYAALKRERGWLDMGDLERTALVLLSDPELSGWVQERLDARVRHLLIDEFQDTNPLQWQALHSWLSSYAGAGNAPSVFIVGDPKQSIYRFRRAEPQVFRAAKEFVVQGLQGDQLSCDHTRRNAPEIIALVNQTMGQAQEEGAYQDFRAHSTASDKQGQVFKLHRIEREAKADNAATPTDAVWRDSLSMPRHEAEETRKTLECRQAAGWLAAQMAQGRRYAPKDVMVLARKRERLTLMEQELSALGIPAQQPEKAELGEFAEVQDLVALLDVLVSPQHDLALARVLKSPVFGASDDDLVALVLRQRALRASTEDAAGKKSDAMSWWQTIQASAEPELPPTLVAVGPTLLRWKQWVDRLPPHDALSAIYDDGDVLARYAAASPHAQRERVLANVRALLNAALQVDGGRYTTAYGLVRALRAGGNPAPVRANAQAVRLLTIHGAKGLEAPLVLILDTDGEAGKTETMGVLVDWPGEAPHPQRFVFLASESRPPACVVDTLAHEQAERSREELNALYVALTRTQQTLVISSLAPHRVHAGSWWRRLEGQAQEVPVEEPAPVALTAGAPEAALVPYALRYVPKVAEALVNIARTAPENIAKFPPEPALESLESRVGQAMHRLLEWVPAPSGGYFQQPYTWSATRLAQVAQAFVLDADQVQTAQQMAQSILQGMGAWAWDALQLTWHANEVPIMQRGRLLRMDRLVQQRSGTWWVLDYKSKAQPQHDAAHCAQLLGYRDAVALANPGQPVRAAFLTPQGQLIELTPE